MNNKKSHNLLLGISVLLILFSFFLSILLCKVVSFEWNRDRLQSNLIENENILFERKDITVLEENCLTENNITASSKSVECYSSCTDTSENSNEIIETLICFDIENGICNEIIYTFHFDSNEFSISTLL